MGKAELDDAMVMKALEDHVARHGNGVSTSTLASALAWSIDGVMHSLARLRKAGRVEWSAVTDAEGIIVRAEWKLPEGALAKEHERQRRRGRTSVFSVVERPPIDQALVDKIVACYMRERNTERVRHHLRVSRSTVYEALRKAGVRPSEVGGAESRSVRPKRALPASITEDDAREIVTAYQELGSVDRAAIETRRSKHTVVRVLDAMGVERRLRQGYRA